MRLPHSPRTPGGTSTWRGSMVGHVIPSPSLLHGAATERSEREPRRERVARGHAALDAAARHERHGINVAYAPRWRRTPVAAGRD